MNRMSDQLLSMMKPDGFNRVCSHEEVSAILGGWSDLLARLRGVDTRSLRFGQVVAGVIDKASTRSERYSEYSLETWMAQAAEPTAIAPEILHARSPLLLSTVAEGLLQGLGFVPGEIYTGWLNRVAIEMMYADAPMFQTNRELLVPLLLHGPVRIRFWHGRRRELAHALKLVIRRTISHSDLTNLIHIEAITTAEHDMIRDSLLTEID